MLCPLALIELGDFPKGMGCPSERGPSVLAGGDDFEPVAVGVGDEVDAHFGVFEADAAHLFVERVGTFVVVDFEGEDKSTKQSLRFYALVVGI